MSDLAPAEPTGDGGYATDGYTPDAVDVPDVPIPTQVAEPFQAALRTILQALTGTLAAWLATVAYQSAGVTLAPGVAEAVAVVVVGAVAGLAARLMAVPGVNAALTSLGLGASRD